LVAGTAPARPGQRRRRRGRPVITIVRRKVSSPFLSRDFNSAAIYAQFSVIILPNPAPTRDKRTRGRRQEEPKQTKVFWFFFSKKNKKTRTSF
jgi:hypothetical protein